MQDLFSKILSNKELAEQFAPEVEPTAEEVNDIVEAANAPVEEISRIAEENKVPVQEDLRAAQAEYESLQETTPQEEVTAEAEQEPELSPQEKLLQEYRALKQERDQGVEKGRKVDDELALLNQANQAFIQMNDALSAGPLTRIKNKAIDFGMPSQEKRADKDSAARIKDLMTEYKLLQSGDKEGLSEYQKRNLDLQERRMDLLEGKEGRLTKKDRFQEGVKNRLSDKEVKEITQLDDGERILDEIDTLLETTNVEQDLGPYASRAENLSAYIPGMEKDPDFVKTQQLVGIQLADYIKSISGAAVSEQEAQRLLKNIPNMQDKPGEFKVKLDTLRKELREAKEDYIQNIGKQKEGAKKFEKEDKGVEVDSPYGKVVERNGKKYQWNPQVGKYQLKR